METTLPQSVSETADPDLLAGSLVFGRMEQVAELFAEHQKRPPLLVWSPSLDTLPNPQLRNYAESCQKMSGGASCIQADKFDVSKIADLSRWLMLVEVIGQGEDFAYTYYGDGITKHYTSDMTGRHTSEFGGFVGRFFIAVYRAAMIRKDWVLSQHEPPPNVFVRCWSRLIVPIIDGLGNVVRFAVLNVPENELRAGLEHVPSHCLVADKGLNLIYANPAASNALGLTRSTEIATYLPDLLGQGIEIQESPEQLLTSRRSISVPVRLDRSTYPREQRVAHSIEFMRAEISGVSFAGRSLYLITLAAPKT